MIYGYIRVSSDKQTVENQRFEINKFCESGGLAIDGWIEETISGTKAYNKRELGNLDGEARRDSRRLPDGGRARARTAALIRPSNGRKAILSCINDTYSFILSFIYDKTTVILSCINDKIKYICSSH